MRGRRESDPSDRRGSLQVPPETLRLDWDSEHDAVHWAPSLDALLGLDPGVTEGSTERFDESVHPDDREQLRTELVEPVLVPRVGSSRRLRALALGALGGRPLRVAGAPGSVAPCVDVFS